MSILTAKSVHDLAMECLFHDGEDQSKAVIVDCIVHKMGFNPERLAKHRPEIEALLAELEDSFQQFGGGGMSFLNACMDKHGNHWGEHRDMAVLFGLGMAIGKVKCVLPRELWASLPGGMPYFVVLSNVPEPAMDTENKEKKI